MCGNRSFRWNRDSEHIQSHEKSRDACVVHRNRIRLEDGHCRHRERIQSNRRENRIEECRKRNGRSWYAKRIRCHEHRCEWIGVRHLRKDEVRASHRHRPYRSEDSTIRTQKRQYRSTCIVQDDERSGGEERI
ncbi:hypothetical protein NY2A_b422L [Paramecium bursaria Chlorella virus NY2A]|uniref:Uncharacterized protein b422L n=1 Tax=Paramecium bursaria Chlorella virus NY2A TaxID=46021 RepID=A7IWU7_PBCVN|nr:hypothetical protein NY2A_b422L [Paramecium bursaria Chlorella virus NY2A]YP_001498451.1 hypothetical protein AR158_c370L [Paramecium bursaria Chlorella virus AR158]ABT14821.1 hypothetical protein NY2A_b422L [Paramecium bursaria Chlorella virus NY2A]ABU43915.1 hypothetical protein AR158_c370L [Paramecium bursaria Chlorella virus AR158]